jgi:ComEC/Rec2-related protein
LRKQDIILLRPAFWLALSFSCGIAVFSAVRQCPFFLCLSFSLAALAAVLLLRGKNAVWFASAAILCFLLGGVWGRAREMKPADDYSRFLRREEEEVYILRGRLCGEPVFRGSKYFFKLKLCSMEIRGRCFSVSGPAALRATFLPPSEGAQEMAVKCRYSWKGLFILDSRRDLCLLPGKGVNFLSGVLAGKVKLKKLLQYKHTPAGAGIISAMVLGERQGIPFLVKRGMLRTGTLHLLVVSGFNTGLVAFFVILLLKAARVPRKIRLCLACLFVAVYCIVTGISPPVFRAAVMTAFILSAYLVRREADLLNLLGCAALVLLVCDPQTLFSVSFQLSFLSVFAIAVFCPLFRVLSGSAKIKNRVLRGTTEALITCLSAWLGTLPLILCYFRLFSWAALPANLLAVPLASLITICGFCQIISVPFLPRLGGYFAFVSDTLVAGLVFLVSFFEHIPGSWVKL